jgi:hypothetical protein
MAAIALSVVACLSPLTLQAQAAPDLPFGIGERLNYRVSVGNTRVGEGFMSVEGPEDVRGIPTYVLKSEMHARIGPVKATDRAASWLDPVRMAALRYRKRERRAFTGSDERVDLYPDEQRWESADGAAGDSPTNMPLDELSFIYFLRTMPFTSDSVMSLVRHYDRDRNPVEVHLVGRDTIRTTAGTFATIVVEMRVKDPGRFHGNGTIRLHLSDDLCRIPVRIETSMPLIGSTVLTLESYARSPAHLVHASP